MGYELKIVLASTSPRRIELMNELGVEFTLADPSSEESSTNSDPRQRVIQNAEAKALSVSQSHPNSLIIGADTIVYLDGKFLGKPENPEDAKRMLMMLSGKTHFVFTGVVFLDTSTGEITSNFDETRGRFKILEKTSIEDYVASGETLDKAGAYAVQGVGAAFIEEYVGSWSNIVGLPMELLRRMLREKGITLET